jgi:hypothetical protein
MWFSIAVSSGLEIAIKYRDVITTLMTPAEISVAEKLAKEFISKNNKEC